MSLLLSLQLPLIISSSFVLFLLINISFTFDKFDHQLGGKQFVLWVQNLVTWPRPCPLRGRFVVRTQQGSVLYVCAKFEADISILSKGGYQNFEIWSRDPGHAHLGVVLWSGRSRGPSSMSVPIFRKFGDRLITFERISASNLANLWMGNLKGKIGNAHARCHVTGW